jgi:tetratricopeptide (TPR) repeat protein
VTGTALPPADRASTGASPGGDVALDRTCSPPSAFSLRAIVRARTRVERSLQRPGTLSGLAWAAAADRLQAAGWTRGAELRALHDPMSAGRLGQALLAWRPGGRPEEADRVLASLPESGVVLHLRARALLALGKRPEALAAYGKALQAFPAHGHETRPFESLVAEARAAHPDSQPVLALVAEHAARSGRLDEARETAEKALTAHGVLAPPELRELVRWLRLAQSGASRP